MADFGLVIREAWFDFERTSRLRCSSSLGMTGVAWD